QSDFTHLSKMEITIEGQPFPHLLYHFVLTYSNWETGTICFSENFESLSEGLQNALWELGGVPRAHQTDRLSSAVQKVGEEDGEEFTPRYRSVLRHYGLEGRAIRAGRANENGDVEQRHHRYKRALEQALLFRGSRDFSSREEYETFLRKLFNQLNADRWERLQDELTVLRRLPVRRLDDCQRVKVKVGPSSTIHVLHNTYTVSSRLIGERVEARAYAKYLEIWYAQRCTEKMPRLRGEGKHRIDYRHLIGWLVRKPGAFANYRYRSELFPSSQFRMAYDALKEQSPCRADREYLKILYLAAQEGESRVEEILRHRLKHEESLDAKSIQTVLEEETGLAAVLATVEIAPVDLHVYDRLMDGEVSAWVH
ncbi:MAG: IS21 family transposase, partial [bacterium]